MTFPDVSYPTILQKLKEFLVKTLSPGLLSGVSTLESINQANATRKKHQ